LFALLGALLFSQIPFFMQQYTQQLAGHVAELQIQIAAIDKLAGQSGKTLQQYIEKFSSNSDTDFVLQGHFMQKLFDRFNEMSEGLNALQQATPWFHPFVFIKFFQTNIGLSTYASFKPGLSLTLESGLYMLAGLLFGYLFYQLLRKTFLAIWHIFRPAKSLQTS
jgi:Protein of unknown function (DUF2937)